MRSAVILCLLAATAAAEPSKGPARPTLPADDKPIRTQKAQCLADVKEVTGWSKEETDKAATQVCDLRTKHAEARAAVIDGFVRLAANFKDATNHEHAQRVPKTISSVQTMVAQCLAALESQQYCHNVQCLTEPEENAVFCEGQAEKVIDRILE